MSDRITLKSLRARIIRAYRRAAGRQLAADWPLLGDRRTSGVNKVRSAAVPLYRFGIRDGERFEDHEGIDLPDNVTARTHAMGII